MDKKCQLVILLGAGSGIAVGAPSTKELTTSLTSVVLSPANTVALTISEEPILKLLQPRASLRAQIEECLKSQFEHHNFEHMIASLEELDSIADAGFTMTDKHKHVLKCFVEISSKFAELNDRWKVNLTRHTIVKDLCKCINDRKKQKDTRPTTEESSALIDYRQFFKELGQQFALKVFTLNYDEYIDDVLDFADGFKAEKDTAFSLFDRTDFINRVKEQRHCLMHLHGSVRYGFPKTFCPESQFDLVKYPSGDEAFEAIGVAPSPQNNNGTRLPAAPIISGFNKAEKLHHRPIPFGYYLNAFTSCIQDCPLLLIIGYSGNDEHLNTWLEEHQAIHSYKRKLVYIGRLTGETVGHATPERRLLDNLRGGSSRDARNVWFERGRENESSGINEFDDMIVISSGFPVSREHQKRIVTFLASTEPGGQ